MSMLDYGDIPYMHTSSQCIHALDTVNHGTLGFIISYNALTHCCSLYARVGWPSLSIHRFVHCYAFSGKVVLGLLPLYLCSYDIRKAAGSSSLCS